MAAAPALAAAAGLGAGGFVPHPIPASPHTPELAKKGEKRGRNDAGASSVQLPGGFTVPPVCGGRRRGAARSRVALGSWGGSGCPYGSLVTRERCWGGCGSGGRGMSSALPPWSLSRLQSLVAPRGSPERGPRSQRCRRCWARRGLGWPSISCCRCGDTAGGLGVGAGDGPAGTKLCMVP